MFIWLTFLVWGVVPLILLGITLAAGFAAGGVSGLVWKLLIPSFPLWVVGIASMMACRDDRLVITRQGICFPFGMAPVLWFRRNRPWYDLKSVSFTGLPAQLSTDVSKRVIHLHYRSGGSASIALGDIKPDEIEQLFLALETFGGDFAGKNALEENKRLFSGALKEKGIKSYTNLWEDELRYRYSSTTFIPLAPGRQLQEGKLKVVRQLGFGGLSAIYLVQQDGRDLAVLKEAVVPADADDDLRAKAVQLFEREAKFLARLKHPNIAGVYDHFVEGGRNYLLIQYIHGQDLRQLVTESGPLPEKDVVKFARQIADVLRYLHKQSPPVVHRDLTPENLVVNDNGQIVLIDFGAANEFLQTATGTLVGKHAYISPEQFRGKASTQSDLYAFGGTLFFLLTGQDPLALSENNPSSINQALSPDLCRIVERLTAVETSERMKSADEALDELKKLVNSEAAVS